LGGLGDQVQHAALEHTTPHQPTTTPTHPTNRSTNPSFHQIKYTVEYAKALSRHPAVHRVDLLTRLVRDPAVEPDYGVEEEVLTAGPAGSQLGGARIVRVACGPVGKYIRCGAGRRGGVGGGRVGGLGILD
jgi:hypothetical protein